MDGTFDYIVVGGGSAGAALAARLSEDPAASVALIEAGQRPPAEESIPAACAGLQLNPETDWMFTADPGRGARSLIGRCMQVPRGRMLGGSSGINYMAWVRGHPGDFDHWAALGAHGWSYDEVLPYFRKSEDFIPTNDITVDGDAHGEGGPVGVTVRQPVLPAAEAFVAAAEAAGLPRGDYNGRGRGGPTGVASLLQTNTRGGRRSSTYHAYLEGEAEGRKNLTILTHAKARRVVLERDGGDLRAVGVEYRNEAGETHQVRARRDVILSAGAVGSPHLLMLSGIGCGANWRMSASSASMIFPASASTSRTTSRRRSSSRRRASAFPWPKSASLSGPTPCARPPVRYRPTPRRMRRSPQILRR